jgi:hypothetical protein
MFQYKSPCEILNVFLMLDTPFINTQSQVQLLDQSLAQERKMFHQGNSVSPVWVILRFNYDVSIVNILQHHIWWCELHKALEGTSHNIFQGSVPAFTLTDWGKTQPTVKTASNLKKIQTRYLSNTNLQCYCSASLFGSLMWQRCLSKCHNANCSFVLLS